MKFMISEKITRPYQTPTQITFPIRAVDQSPLLNCRIIELISGRRKNLSSIR